MAELRIVNVTEAKQLVVGGALLLDVRDQNEWEAGRAPSAIHVPLSELPDHLDDFARERLIVCVCRSGGRSGRAARFLAVEGFDVANLDGGMIAWASDGEDLIADGADPTVV